MSAAARVFVSAPMLAALAAVAAGVAVGDALELGSVVPGALLVGALALAMGAVKRGRGAYLAALLTLALAGATLAGGSAPAAPVPPGCSAEDAPWRVRVASVTGRVFRSGELARRVQLDLLAERCADAWQPRRGRVTATIPGGAALAQGDVLELSLRVEPRGPRRNPTDPDPVLAARRDGIGGRGFARSPAALVVPGDGLLATLDRARDGASARLEAHLAPALATIAKALSNGDQAAVDDALRERWSASGLSHLLSVSGLHVTLVATLAFFVAARLLALVPGLAERFSVRRASALLALGPVVLFCVWAGAPPAAVRATVMGGAMLVGLAIGRPSAVLNACGVAGTGILLASPASLYDPGFLLSFIAILFLLIRPSPPAAAGLLARARRAALGLVAASVVATLATTPVTAAFFGRVSLVGPLVNLVGVPLGSAVATPLALAFTLVAPLSDGLAAVVAFPLRLTLAALDRLAALAATLPWATVDVPAPSGLEVAGFYVALVSLVSTRRGRVARTVAAAGLLVTATSAALRYAAERRSRDLVVLHPYVGQGDAALLRLPDGAAMVVDAGGGYDPEAPDPGQRTLAPLLRRRGVRVIDLAVLTHPHPDHVGGFTYLAAHFPVRELWWSGEAADLPPVARLLAAVRAAGGEVHTAAELAPIERRGGLDIAVLHPRPGPEAEGLTWDPAMSSNDNSVVLRLAYGRRSILLPGDIEAPTEATLSPVFAPTDILKSPHHASSTSSSWALLRPLAPRVVIISLGDHNHFGFPSASVMSRYEAAGATVLRTDRDGMIEVRTDGDSLVIRTASGRQIGL